MSARGSSKSGPPPVPGAAQRSRPTGPNPPAPPRPPTPPAVPGSSSAASRPPPPPLPPDSGRAPKRAAPRSRSAHSVELPPEVPSSIDDEPLQTLETAAEPDEPTRRFEHPDPEDELLEASEPSVLSAVAPPVELSPDADTIITSLHSFLEQELDHAAGDPSRQAVLLYEMGHLDEVVLRDRERALARYQRAFALDRHHLPVLHALRRHYYDREHWDDCLDVLGAELEATAHEEARAALLTAIGEIQWRRMDDPDSAIESLRQALTLAPRYRPAAELLRAIFARGQKWQDLFGLLQRICNITRDDAERGRLTVEMAELAEFRLEQPERAEELYAHALALDAGNEKAAVALRRLYLLHRRWQELSELLAVDAGREHEPDEMFADMYRAARIAEVHLHDDGRAASLLETAAALRPSDPLPLVGLTEIYQRTGRQEEYAAALRRRLRLVRDPSARADLHYRLGRLCEDWLQQPEQAAEAYRQAVEEQPDHEASLRALAGLYDRLERWSDLLEIELLRAERCRDAERRASGYLAAALLCERRLQDVRRATDLYDRAWRTAPGSPEAFRALDRIYRAEGLWEPLAELYERRAALSDDGALTVSLLRGAAALYEQRLDDLPRAIAILEKLLHNHPGDREALMQLARLYEAAGRVEELRQTLVRWAELTEDPIERVELSRRVGELLEGPLRRLDSAVEIYRRILSDAPEDRSTRERLKAIYERSGRWDDLVEVLTGELTVEPDSSERAALQLQIGRICEDKLGDLDRAARAYRAALEIDPRLTPALIALEELLRQRHSWEPLLELLIEQATLIREPMRAAATLCRAGELCEEELGRIEQAEQCYYRALDLDPGCAPARHGLERLYQRGRDRSALEAHYLREAEQASNPVLRVRAYLRLASLLDGPAGDPMGAAAAYESALRVADDQPDALHALAAVSRRTGSWDRLGELLARIAATAEDSDAAVAALMEWGAIVEVYQQGRWDPQPIYARVLEGDPREPLAIAALERLAYRGHDEHALLGLVMRQIKMLQDPRAVASLCVGGALVLVARSRFPEAADVLRRAVHADPGYLPAVRMLRRLDEQLDNWEEASRMLLREGELSSRPDARHAALIKAGNVLLDRFGDVPGARRAFERVFSEDAQSGGAFGRLAEILSASHEWRELVQLYRRRMEAVDARARIALQLQLAEIYREQLADLNSAIEVLCRVLDTDSRHAIALEQLATLCGEQRRWREAEEFLEQLADAADDSGMQIDALLRRAEILEEQLGEERTALQVLEHLLALHPGERAALSRKMRIHRRWGDWQRAVEVLHELTRDGPVGERIDGLVDLAEICSRTLGDEPRAQKALRRAATLCVDSGAGIERVSEYFERRGDFEGLVALFGEVLQQLPPEGSPGAVAVRLARSRVLAGRLLRPRDAEREIREALRGAPDSIEARLELAALHLWGDELAKATAEYQRVLQQDPLCQEAYRGLYRVHERRGDLDRAAGAAQAASAVGQPNETERRLAVQMEAGFEASLASAAATPLGIEGFWRLMAHPDEPRQARELLFAIADFLPGIFSAEVDEHSGGAIIPLDPADELAARCAACARVLGVDRVSYCVGQGKARLAEAVPGERLRIVVDEKLAARASEPEFRFAVGTALAEVLTRTVYLRVLAPRALEGILAAAAEMYERGFSGYLAEPMELEELTRRLTRSIPRKVRKMLEEPARAYAAAGPVQAARWRLQARRSAERAGLLLSGSLGACLAVLEREQSEDNARAELLRFAVGPHLYEARRILGLAI